MKIRLLIITLALGLGGWLLLLGIEWQLGLGRFARSPQVVELAPGRRIIVAGGRAVLGFARERYDRAEVEVRCAAEQKELSLLRQTPSEPVCGVRLRWLEPSMERRQPDAESFEVSWGDS